MNIPGLGQSLSTLLQIEDDNELIGIVCPATGLPVWPLIRVPVLRTIMSDWLYKSEPLLSLSSKINFINLAKNAVISSFHNFGYKANSQRNVLIQSTGLGNYSRDGIVHDRLVGYFTEALSEQAVVYQEKPKGSFQEKYSLKK